MSKAMTSYLVIAVMMIFSLTSGSVIGNAISSAKTQEQVRETFLVPSPSPTPAPPIQLEIPKINVIAQIKPVGLDPGGKMGVPENANEVGWYNLGAKPGEKGNAVLDGHLDTVTGAPAIFYDLTKLEMGDFVYLTDESGKKYTYVVKNKASYLYNQFPIDEIFGFSDNQNLNLITCEGYFDNRSQNYSHRTVVYTEIVQDNNI